MIRSLEGTGGAVTGPLSFFRVPDPRPMGLYRCVDEVYPPPDDSSDVSRSRYPRIKGTLSPYTVVSPSDCPYL